MLFEEYFAMERYLQRISFLRKCSYVGKGFLYWLLPAETLHSHGKRILSQVMEIRFSMDTAREQEAGRRVVEGGIATSFWRSIRTSNKRDLYSGSSVRSGKASREAIAL